MKSGIELIAEERKEQIEKHGFSVINDAEYYKNDELIQATLFCINQVVEAGSGLTSEVIFPPDWDVKFEHKILAKDDIGQLKVGAAFLAAEIDRRLALKQQSK